MFASARTNQSQRENILQLRLWFTVNITELHYVPATLEFGIGLALPSLILDLSLIPVVKMIC